jgi:hypothetical protein
MHEHIEPAEPPVDQVNELIDPPRLGQVGDQRDSSGAMCRDGSDRIGEPPLVAPDHTYVGSAGGERHRDGPPDSAAGTRDKRGAPVQRRCGPHSRPVTR